VARELDWRALRVARGVCPLCRGSLFVRISLDVLGTRCVSCKASPISMAIGTVLKDRVPRFADLRVCELSSGGPFFAFLSRATFRGQGTLTYSEYFEDAAPGSSVDGVPCQDVQHLTYADQSFDVCTSTEVFEHVPDDRRGFAEMFRVLAPGGRLIFTVPLSDEPTTRERAIIDEQDGELCHVLPPTYHDDFIRGAGRVLVYRDYGRDITSRLESAGFVDVRIEAVGDPAGFGTIAQVVVARKP
jgi:SAM-dependent methyltransferase